MDIGQKSLELHKEYKGKIEVISRVPVTNREELSLAYTPGVAQPCIEINKNPELAYDYTRKGNLVAVITDGTAVLGLGDIGGKAAMPVMEGKCVLFKQFAGIDAFPICINSKDTDEIVRTIELISDSFGGINLEDISAPRCFEIEKRLKEKLDIPVFHDDQHGTAIVVLAALINAVKLAGKTLKNLNIVINGSGSAGIAIAKLLIRAGAGNVIMVDLHGILRKTESYENPAHNDIAVITNKNDISGTLENALINADVFIGVSAPNVLKQEMIRSMADKPVIFALANPTPEIMPEEAINAGAYIVGTGRSDYPNQINNVLVFPGIFKGALAVKAHDITDNMKLAAAYAISGLVQDDLRPDYIIPNPFDNRVADAVSKAVISCYYEDLKESEAKEILK